MPDETDFLVHAPQASGESAPTRRKIRLEQAHATYTGLRSTLVKENPPRQARTPDSYHRTKDAEPEDPLCPRRRSSRGPFCWDIRALRSTTRSRKTAMRFRRS